MRESSISRKSAVLRGRDIFGEIADSLSVAPQRRTRASRPAARGAQAARPNAGSHIASGARTSTAAGRKGPHSPAAGHLPQSCGPAALEITPRPILPTCAGTERGSPLVILRTACAERTALPFFLRAQLPQKKSRSGQSADGGERLLSPDRASARSVGYSERRFG